MIRVGIDGSTLLVRQKTGIERYTEQLIIHLAALIGERSDVELHIYLHTGNRYADPALEAEYRSRLGSMRMHKHANPRAYNVYLPYRSAVDRLDLLHIPGPSAPRVNVCPLLITCHDVLWMRLPPEGIEVESRNVDMANRAISKAMAIIAVSATTKQDLIDYSHKRDDEIDVVHSGVDSRFHPQSDATEAIRSRYHVGPYLLNVGAIQYRKNHVRLLQAFDKLVREHDIPHTLVIAGRDGWGSDHIYAEYERLQLGPRVCFLGYVPEEDLPLLYAAADLVVYPSIYEGFGLPLLEAMASGVVLAVANTSSLPEVGGEAALYFDPFDVDDMAHTILRGIMSIDDRQRLREMGIERAGEFTWQKTARETLDVYRKVIARNKEH